MKLLLLAFIIIDDSLVLCSQFNHTYTLSIDGDVVQIVTQIKSLDFGFPELECLQFEYSRDLVTTNIKYLKGVCIHVDGFVTDKQFLDFLASVINDINVCISNIKLILVLQNELLLVRILFIKLDQEEAQFLLMFVAKYIELFIFRLINHFINVRYIEFLIQIDKRIVSSVIINTVIL